MKKRSIYQNRSQELLTLFEAAGNSAKVMCVPIDYAKKHHMAMFCNGYGDILRQPFAVKNSPDDVNFLIDQVTRSCRYRRINRRHVFFGSEDICSGSENFVYSLRTMGWLMASVNAHDAKKQRENLQASTDRVDLMGIAGIVPRVKQSGGQDGLRVLPQCAPFKRMSLMAMIRVSALSVRSIYGSKVL